MDEVVLALKFTTFGRNFSFGKDRRWSKVTAVLPVPVGPTNRMGMLLVRHIFKK